ncbi:hypothetical protein Pcinc_002560 [Petrolisthes cinctipes]|uniref:Uncharacterized protein n=1 Tax=Petrolisthes cinctipes TaxID=88211 RepID=A0AAE1L3C7_PETCI|nr:hypothetical protein Pcinc_002560 [Petrolisthes cinctipes]
MGLQGHHNNSQMLPVIQESQAILRAHKRMQSILRVNEVGLLVVEEASTTTWNPDQGSDARQQVWVVAQVSSQRESGRVVGRQARQERVESAGPGERELDGNLGSARDPL